MSDELNAFDNTNLRKNNNHDNKKNIYASKLQSQIINKKSNNTKHKSSLSITGEINKK